MDLRIVALELKEENISLKSRINELEEQLKIIDKLEFDGRVYWLGSEETEEKEGPFCSRCWEADQKLIRIIKLGSRYPICPECNTMFPSS